MNSFHLEHVCHGSSHFAKSLIVLFVTVGILRVNVQMAPFISRVESWINMETSNSYDPYHDCCQV